MIVDRIEGKTAVVEIAKGKFRNIPLDLIEGHARDGAVLTDAGAHYIVDETATIKRAREVNERRRDLFKRR